LRRHGARVSEDDVLDRMIEARAVREAAARVIAAEERAVFVRSVRASCRARAARYGHAYSEPFPDEPLEATPSAIPDTPGA
jgi:hypothetical protein